MNQKTRRSGIQVMGQMIGLVKPLLHIMTAAVILGTAGYLCAIFLTVLAGEALLHGLTLYDETQAATFLSLVPVKTLFALMAAFAVSRGILHYAEQYCNHFIAFKLLAIIRHKVFAALRRLCPAKLDGREKGNLISIITTDIELLEVFYAHTISPIAIAIATSGIMVAFISQYSIWSGFIALASYLIVGILIPVQNGKRGAQQGMKFRTEFGELNSFVLDSLRGLDETIQYGQGVSREEELQKRSAGLGKIQEKLSKREGVQRSSTNLVVLLCSFGMLFVNMGLYQANQVSMEGLLISTIAMMGSFGPVIALSNLSNNLNQTLASGERVLSLLEEIPMVEEVPEGGTNKSYDEFLGAEVNHVTFAYEEEEILHDYSLAVKPGQIVGIHGASGSGKSTMLKLLMRFWDVNQGSVMVSGQHVKNVPTKILRDTESYVTQETHLFHDSIANNIAVAKADATREEIMEAAKKASVHDFIMSLPHGYDTQVGELGDTLSGGEKQRIGIARAFLHDAPLLLLDEPTSNLDSLNEGIILKSLQESCKTNTVILVSHRKSTMNLADIVFEMSKERVS